MEEVNNHSDQMENPNGSVEYPSDSVENPSGSLENPNGIESVVIDLRSNSLTVKDTNAWLKESFGPVGAYGSIKRELFVTALREVEVRSEYILFDFV